MHLKYKSTWQKAGIYNAVLNSSYKILKNHCLLLRNGVMRLKHLYFFGLKLVLLWRTFWFLVVIRFWVEMFLMLIVGSDVESEKALGKLGRSSYRNASQGGWINMFKDSGSEIEHEAFLALWLSRFVFPLPSNVIVKSLCKLEVCLPRGVRLALAPSVLASTVYKDLSFLKDKIGLDDETPVVVRAPMQLVQIWIWERFPKISPKCEIGCIQRFARWEKTNPYVKDSNENSGLVGLDGSCIQQYLPHRVAMQFGMNQDVPADVARVNETREIAWEFYTRPVKDAKLYIPSRLSEPYVTAIYLEWRNKTTGECSLQSPIGDIETEIIGKDESRSDGGDDIRTLGKLEARISKLEEVYAYLKAKKTEKLNRYRLASCNLDEAFQCSQMLFECDFQMKPILYVNLKLILFLTRLGEYTNREKQEKQSPKDRNNIYLTLKHDLRTYQIVRIHCLTQIGWLTDHLNSCNFKQPTGQLQVAHYFKNQVFNINACHNLMEEETVLSNARVVRDVAEELIGIIEGVKSMGEIRGTQKKECQNLVRRLRQCLPLMEELRDLDAHIPEVCISCLRKLKKAFILAKKLLKTCHAGSKIYLILEADAMVTRFHSVYDKLNHAMDGFPYKEIGISEEVNEELAMYLRTYQIVRIHCLTQIGWLTDHLNSCNFKQPTGQLQVAHYFKNQVFNINACHNLVTSIIKLQH
ncbi:Aminotransferase-like mobile domain-containing protein [Artemisia annua]|uniref:RING-type E3 ubiquitin transferase n=1 Tax=Artemisia annua TaxID=35608 RepID=A0A2U1KU31_ARTAN|nr:Aminotransferase-like mobile domain-containing protein [Artemisia annua]